MVDIKGLPKSKVLAYLYNNTHPQGLGFLQFEPKPMTEEEAQKILDSGVKYFDYLKGRVMKVDISKDEFDPRLYDRDNYDGAAEAAINQLRKDIESTNKIMK